MTTEQTAVEAMDELAAEAERANDEKAAAEEEAEAIQPAAAEELRVSGKLWDDFVAFSRGQLACQDVDPVYPVLRILQGEMGKEQALWHTLLYVAYYNIASATEAFAYVNWPGVMPEDLSKLPTGTERRGLRGGEPLNRHLASLIEIVSAEGSLTAWLMGWAELDWDEFGVEERYEAYRIVRDTKLREPWGNGRWAAYKTAEILQKVNGLPLLATDMGNDESTGPRQGLELLYGPVQGNSEDAIAQLDAWGESTRTKLWREGVLCSIDEVETLLCDFHAMASGHYYIGHDIDQMHDQIVRHEELRGNRWTGPLWRARSNVFPVEYLAEKRGSGVDRERAKAYRDSGEILLR